METAVKSPDHALAPINKALKPDDKIQLLREMLRIRRFEQRALNEYTKGKMGGFMHLYIGQESVAVGACSLMGDDDHVITAYRCHGHALAVGMSMNECMAALEGVPATSGARAGERQAPGTGAGAERLVFVHANPDRRCHGHHRAGDRRRPP